MSKTYDLRIAVKGLLKTLEVPVYYENAKDDTSYPYIVFEFTSVNLDNHRDDVLLDVNVWDRSYNSKAVEDLADSIEDLLDYKNYPTDTVLPTFYKNIRQAIPDEDKEIRRRNLQFTIQNYER